MHVKCIRIYLDNVIKEIVMADCMELYVSFAQISIEDDISSS